MVSKDLQLFNLLNRITQKKFERFEKFYRKDSKGFVNKIDRDYKKSRSFPVHVLKQIKKINKKEYDSAVCILRGALPYAVLFEATGWKVHYVVCGRINEKVVNNEDGLRFNKSVDKTIAQIAGKKVLIIENNSFSGNTPYRVAVELKKAFKIKKPDLFLDYFCREDVFKKNREKFDVFGKIFVASKLRVSGREKDDLVGEFLERLGSFEI